MNDNNRAVKVLAEQIRKAINTTCSKLEYDKTYTGVISKVHENGYLVKFNGTETNIETSATELYQVGDHVKICIPNGNRFKAYIIPTLELISKIKNSTT